MALRPLFQNNARGMYSSEKVTYVSAAIIVLSIIIATAIINMFMATISTEVQKKMKHKLIIQIRSYAGLVGRGILVLLFHIS